MTHGKGRHPARLNYVDCFAGVYPEPAKGSAKALDESLLFIGNDFPRTDIAQAL